MNYDANVRKEIKAEQKQIVLRHYPRILGVHILYALPFILIGLIGAVMTFNSMVSAVMSANLYAVTQASQSVDTANTIVWIMQIAVGGPLLFGLRGFQIELMRGKEPGVGLLFHPFTSLRTLWRSIRMCLVLYLRSLIWTIVPTILYMIFAFTFLIGSMVAGGGEPEMTSMATSFLLLTLLYLIALGFISVKIATYQAGYVCLYDNEYIGTWDATRAGAEAFRGHYKDVLVFFLSFTPWFLLYVGLVIAACIPMIGGLISTGGLPFGAAVSGSIITIILILAIVLLYIPFLTSYQQMSFMRLFERLAPAPEQPPAVQKIDLMKPSDPVQNTSPQPEQPENGESTENNQGEGGNPT